MQSVSLPRVTYDIIVIKPHQSQTQHNMSGSFSFLLHLVTTTAATTTVTETTTPQPTTTESSTVVSTTPTESTTTTTQISTTTGNVIPRCYSIWTK